MALTRPTAYQINTVSTTITDPLTVLNQGSTAANIDIGFILNRSPSANVAIVWQASSNQFIFANTSSSGTTNANITVSSYANLRTGNLITTSVTYANGQSILTNVESAITTANTNLKGYTDGQISTTTTAITTANTNLKGYVDSANTIQSGQITTVSSSVTGANAAIVTANTNLKGYTDGQISTTTTAITTANTNLKGYVDGQISTRAALSGATFTGAVTSTELFVTSPGGDEGGQINLAKAVTNTTLVGNVTIDVYQNKLRIWEGGGTNRGGYFDLTGLSASVGTNLAAGGGGTPGGADTQVQFNNSSSFGGALSLHYFTGNGVVLTNAAVASTSTTTGALQVSGGIGVAGNVWCGQVYSTNNGNGTNYRIGDDAWLGDVNLADTTRLMGVQNGNNGYLQFGNVGTETLGRAGSGALTWTGTFSATSINSDNHNYANGTSIITTLSNTITTANTNMKGYVDGQISTTTTAITTANTNMKGYVDAANTIQSGQITTVSSSVTGANAAIVTANTNMKGYVDNSVSSLSSNKISASGSNVTVTASFVNVAINSSNVASVSSAGLSITGNIIAGNVSATNLTGTLLTASQTNITGVGTLGSLTVTGNVSAANLTASFGLYGTIRTAAQTTVTSVGTLTSLAVSGAITVNSGNNLTAIVNGGTAGVGNIGASGQGFNTVFARATSAQYADLAEVYTSDRNYIPGTVVVFGGSSEVTVSLTSHDPAVAGVVSTNPAYLMNDREDGSAVALQGRVPCRVLGPVIRGDRVVTSDVRGVAERLDMSKYQPGCIIGKTLGSVPDGEIATIEVVVGRV